MLPLLLLQMVSTMANTSIQEVASTSQHPCLLFQLYVIRDRALVQQWVQQAEAAGYKGLVITVDAQRLVRQMQACMRASANIVCWAVESVRGHAAHMGCSAGRAKHRQAPPDSSG
jgi:isopentenyl diphosphate isomerase/L-lactate dehydrogenase-like FMN-dependent dehydrogenase